MPQKGNIALIVLILVAALFAGFGAYQYWKVSQVKPIPPVAVKIITTPSPTSALASPSATLDPTIDWTTYTSTYTDPEQNFSFKYPSTYYLSKESPGKGSTTITDTSQTDRKLVINKPLATDDLAINAIELVYTGVDPNDKTNLLQSLINNKFGVYDEQLGYSKVPYQTIQIAGINSAKVVDNNGLQYIIPLTGSYIWLTFSPTDTTKADIVNQIINSLTLTQ